MIKTVKLKAIHNRPKRTISVNSTLGMLQIVSEPDIEQCDSEDAGPKGVD